MASGMDGARDRRRAVRVQGGSGWGRQQQLGGRRQLRGTRRLELARGGGRCEREGLHARGRRHARNRVTVRAGARHAEQRGEPVLHAGRQRVLEPVRLLVRLRPVQAERVGEPAFQEPVPPRHHLGDLASPRGERHFLAVAHPDVAAARQAVQRLGDGRRGHRHVLGEPRADHRPAAGLEVVDRGEVVLGRRRGGVRGHWF